VLLATVASGLYLTLGTLLFGAVSLPLAWIPPRGRLFFWFCRRWGRGWLAAAGVRVGCEIEEPLEASGRYVFMANHSSYFDIPAMMATLPVETRFMAKRSIFRVPVVGHAMRAGGFIGVDRKDKSRARDALTAAVRELRSCASVLIFPEGTRSPSGRVGEFQRGGFLIALRSGRPIVPVGIQGSFDVQPRKTWTVRPGRILVRYGRPVDVTAYGVRGLEELAQRVRQRVAELSGDPSAGARAGDSDKVGRHG
jgi:1-acyl-sn-glycerol-3-phosphate acyltransferase